jgi:hypothetical protein
MTENDIVAGGMYKEGEIAERERMKEQVKKLRLKFVNAFLYADRFYEKNELQTKIKKILDEWEKETFGEVLEE